MLNVTIALSDIKTHGGAKLFFDNLTKHLPQFNLHFTQGAIPANSDVLIYGNRHDFYTQAKALNIPKIIQRTQGQRAMNLQQPEDLHAVVCSSQKSYQLSTHPNKTYICNGIDYALADSLKPINCDLLCAESRIAKGQRIGEAIQWAVKHNRRITILGSKQGSAEKVDEQLKIKYPNCEWVGLVDYTTSLQYIKGCKELVVASPAHGLSNSVLAATYFQKPIQNIGGVEIPITVPDMKVTAENYIDLINGT